MKLRRQLILVSLLTLSLPWAGCQYVREMEEAMRTGQGRALLATAEAVANRLASEPLLIAELTQNFATVTPTSQLYAHPLSTPPQLDGYDEEWRHWQFYGKHWQQQHVKVSAQAAYYDKHVYLFFDVQDHDLDYYHPNQAGINHADHILLRTLDRDGRLRDFILVASSPGAISAFDINMPNYQRLPRPAPNDLDLAGDIFDVEQQTLVDRRQEHAIKGVWQERAGGYQVELQIPWYLTQGYLGIAVVNPVKNDTSLWLGSITADSPPAPLVKHSDTLRSALAVFASDDLRLRLATNNQWLIAEAGSLQSMRSALEHSDWLTRLLRSAFTRRDFPPLDTPELDGHLSTEEISQALTGEKSAQWYFNQQQTLARAAVPIRSHGHIVGAVITEQTSASLLALTDTAFRRLVFYTLFATGLAGLGLLTYASWLSLRIRKLSRAADTAIREDGNLEDAFTPSSAQDEIGDLSRSYNQLLTRVQEYTDYLRTLSNKLSHELRTPLAVVRSSLDNLDSENLSEQAKIYAVRAHEGSQRLSAILNAISSASRVEESIRHADMSLFSFSQLLQELTQAYQDIAQQKIICLIDAGKDYDLYGSPDLIVQMLDKLFDNACDFCPSDGTITFSLARIKGSLTLTVANDGPSLPQHMQSQLFDSLVSIRENKSEHGKNDQKIHLGLGLHIVRLIAELHQARVNARNRHNPKGVEFTVSFSERFNY